MKFMPLEFVTNTFAGPSSAAAGMEDKSNADGGDSSADEVAPTESQRVRFQLPSDSESEPDSQFFLLGKEPTTSTRSSTRRTTASNRKQAANKRNKASPPKQQTKPPPNTRGGAKTPSPGKNTTKTISPQGVTPLAGKNSASPSVAKKSKEAQPKTPSTTTPSKETCETPADKENQTSESKQSQKKKRLSVYEQIAADTNAASEQWKEYTEATLRFKKQIHKEKLREIKEKEDDLKKLEEQLAQLRKKASELELDIQKDLENKKVHVKLGNNLRRLADRVSKKATKDREDSKANLKAKDALLKQARKDVKKAALEQENDRSKKKRKVSPDSKQKASKRSKRKEEEDDQSSDDESLKHLDSEGSDADDSDWEGAGKAKTSRKPADGETTEASAPSSRRQTRVRASQWKCSVCTLDNSMDDDECAACATPRPGAIPDF